MTTRPKLPLEIFDHWETKSPDRIFLRQPVDGQWREFTFRETGTQIRKIAAALKALNLPAQSRVAILSKNCAHWFMADLAIWMSGHISVPIYPTLSANSIRQIMEHSDAKVIFVGKLDDYKNQQAGVPSSAHTISFPFYEEKALSRWDDLLNQNAEIAVKASIHADQLATIMYTSGTTGKPKGVMVTFGAMAFVITAGLKHLGTKDEKESFFSYLPLSHIAERNLVELGAIYSGGMASFSESLEKFPQNLFETQPTTFLAVPRIWSKFQEKILEKMPQKKLDRLLSIPLINTIIKKAIRKKLGLGRTRWFLTGAAPMSVSLLKWWDKLGVTIHEVYGMSENLAYSHINLNEVRFGTVGKTWPEVQVRITEEGEIQTKHDGQMSGYYLEPGLTKEVFTEDGYLRTGDKGEVDKDGFLTITGRIKDQFKTDKAKYVDPAPIELMLSSNPDIEQVCVVGMGIPQPIALTTLSAAARKKPKEEIAISLEKTINEVNKSLEVFERVKAAIILSQDWTVENGFMTPSLKVKRNELEKVYLPNYPLWYAKEKTIVWE